MTAQTAGTAADREVVAAARVLLQRMGVDPADLMQDPADRPQVPTFDEYIPQVEAAVSPGTAGTYGSYWKRIAAKWGPRSLLDPTSTEIEQFKEEIKANAVQRRNSRGGRGTAENFIAALRCLYKHAEKDGLIKPDENPAAKTPKPRRQDSTRHALPNAQMSEINFYAGATDDDPELDTLLIRLHTESACRTGGALALRSRDLNQHQCLIYLQEKEGTARWQPVSRSLMTALIEHAEARGAAAQPNNQLLRYRNGYPITHRRYDHLTLLLRFHEETAARRGGALALRTPYDLDPDQCLVRLHEKGGTDRWQPVSPTLMAALEAHGEDRDAPHGSQLFRYRNGNPLTGRRYDYLWSRLGRHLHWVAAQQVTIHWLRYATLTWVERNFSYAIARAYAGHFDNNSSVGATATYVRAGLQEVAAALAALTGEPHPLAPPNRLPE